MVELLAEKPQEKQEEKQPSPPRRYAVYLLNDNITTMDFVVFVLQEIFSLPQSRAESLMWRIHHEGKAICGIYSKDIAQTKQQEVLMLAAAEGFPLRCCIEAED